jgi:hypothetical protein
MSDVLVTHLVRAGDGYRCDVEFRLDDDGEVISIPNVAAHPRRSGDWHLSMPYSIALSRGLRDRVHATVAAALVSVDGGARHGDAA